MRSRRRRYLIGSPVDVARFQKAFRPNGEPAASQGNRWLYAGFMAGTYVLAVEIPGGVALVALFNQREA
jgi:hypothetical protein